MKLKCKVIFSEKTYTPTISSSLWPPFLDKVSSHENSMSLCMLSKLAVESHQWVANFFFLSIKNKDMEYKQVVPIIASYWWGRGLLDTL